jgi:hypothetical protein
MRVIIKITIFISILILGILIGKVVKDWPLFTLNYSLSITHIISIGTTLFIAILISYYFDKEKQNNRNEKDLILKRMDDVYMHIETLSTKIEDGSISYQEAASKVKRINMAFTNVFNVIKISDASLDDVDKKDFLDKSKSLRNLLTETPKLDEDELKGVEIPIEVKDGIIKYTQARISEIETLFERIKSQLLELQLKINKS